MKYHETESIAALRTRRSATDPGRHLRRGHGATAVTGMAPCAAGKSMEGVGVKKGVFAKEKQLEMRQPNSAIGKSEPCRQKGWLPQVPVRSHVATKMQSMQNVQTLFVD